MKRKTRQLGEMGSLCVAACRRRAGGGESCPGQAGPFAKPTRVRSLGALGWSAGGAGHGV